MGSLPWVERAKFGDWARTRDGNLPATTISQPETGVLVVKLTDSLSTYASNVDQTCQYTMSSKVKASSVCIEFLHGQLDV